MKKTVLKRLVTVVLALCMMCACLVPSIAAGPKTQKGDADSKSLIERIQHDDLQGMTDDAMAHLIAWATTNNPENMAPELSRALLRNHPVKDITAIYKMKQFYFESFDGTNLKVSHFTTPKGCEWDGKKHVVICAHGFQTNQIAAMLQVPMFADLGYDVITWDQRQAGDSDQTKCTMGANESKDCLELVKWVRAKYGSDVVLGLYGQSMGAATVMMASPHVKNLAFLIEDCGYADLKATMKDIQGQYLKFINFDNFYEAANRYATVGDVNYDSVKPIRCIRALDPSVPALFLHGEGDTYIAPKNVKKLYNAKRGIRAMKTFPLAGHSQSYFFDIPGYTECVANFLAKNVK